MATKYIAKVEYSGEKGQEEWAYLAKDTKGTAELIQSIVSLYNKGYRLYDNAIEPLQLAKDSGFTRVKLVTFEPQENGKPFLEVEIV
jgi:hypothetical protein